jgi:hypothetical protein
MLVEVVGVVYLLSHIFIPASAPILGHRPTESRRFLPIQEKVGQIVGIGRPIILIRVREVDDGYGNDRSFTLVDNNLISDGAHSIFLAIAPCFALSQAAIGALRVETSPDDLGVTSTPLSVESWRTILSAVPNVRAAVFHRDSSGWILRALCSSTSTSHDQLPCPPMRAIYLGPPSAASDSHPNCATSSLSLARATVETLKACADFGAAPLRLLQLSCGDDETTTKLKSLVHFLGKCCRRATIVLPPRFP